MRIALILFFAKIIIEAIFFQAKLNAMNRERKTKFVIYELLDRLDEMGIEGDEKVTR